MRIDFGNAVDPMIAAERPERRTLFQSKVDEKAIQIREAMLAVRVFRLNNRIENTVGVYARLVLKCLNVIALLI